MNPINRKTIVFGVLFVLALIFFIIVNPFSWNDAGNRTVVERTTGEQIVQFAPGIFYAGFFSKEKEWPNQISVTYQDATAQLELEDNGIEVGQIMIRFSDATTADVRGITQFILPSDEKEMILIHNTHRTPQSLVVKTSCPLYKRVFAIISSIDEQRKTLWWWSRTNGAGFSRSVKGRCILIENRRELSV
jgi:hypothetical protein